MPLDDHSDDPPVLGSSCSCSESPIAHAAAAWSRRTFLRRTVAGILGLSFGGSLLDLAAFGRFGGVTALHAASAAGPEWPLPPEPIAKSIILLWLNGGPSQLDTFDPKPGNVNGGPTKAIATAINGVQLSANLPQLAAVLDRCALVRCMSTGEGNHSRARELMHTGFKPNPTVAYPGLGSIVSLEHGDLRGDLPCNVAINSPGQKAGLLGMAVNPLVVQSRGNEPVRNLKPPAGVTAGRVDRRLRLLAAQDRQFTDSLGGGCPEAAANSIVLENALRFMRSDQTVAFNVDEEPESLRAAYGETPFGRGCLMARRLVERGVKFVEVTLDGWDSHADNFTRVSNLCGSLDPAFATLVRDLDERKLLDSTLVICMGEFGRTPKINDREGRDHYARAWSVVLAGGGTRPGTVIGETSADGTEVVGNAVTTADLFRTLLWLSAVDPDYKYYSPKGRPVTYADGGRLITSLIRPPATVA